MADQKRDGDPRRCPRCGETRVPHEVYDVCVPCAAGCGWDPHCEACVAEERDSSLTRVDHIATCGPGQRRSTPVSEEPAPRPCSLSSCHAAAAQAYALGRRQATEGLTLQHEDEQWSVWWKSPGGGLNVSVPTDEDDHEAAARSFQAEFGGELKRRRRVTLVGPWEPVEQPEPTEEDIRAAMALSDDPPGFRPNNLGEWPPDSAAEQPEGSDRGTD